MSFKKIIIPVTGADQDISGLVTAFAAAGPFSGHVRALFVHPDPREAVPFVGMPVAPEVLQQIIDNAETVSHAAEKAAGANVAAAAKDNGVELVAHPHATSAVTCSYQEVQGSFITEVVQAARLCDLVVFGPSTLEGGPDVRGAFIETLTQSERPVLLGPVKPVTDLTRKIMVGWDGSFAAAHALTAALPLLAHAARVDVCWVRSEPDGENILDEAIEYLALHEVVATSRVIEPAGLAAGEALLQAAQEGGASLLVLGGYGHSRLLETLFGGTTVHIASHATLPLFMVH